MAGERRHGLAGDQSAHRGGRGYERELTRRLVAASLERGVVQFLHVSVLNTHAIALYERWGFVRTGEFQMWKVRRPGAES
jgi:predicted GNAT family acetyltransferase